MSGAVAKSPSLTLLTREGVYVKAMQAGLLTDGSSYSPTPSQRIFRQWPILLAFVPDHSGAPVRELHPLPVSITYIAIAQKDRAAVSHHAGLMSIVFFATIDLGSG